MPSSVEGMKRFRISSSYISNEIHLKTNSATVYSKMTGSGLNKLPQHGKNAAGRNFNLGLIFFNDFSLQQRFKKWNQSALVLLCCRHPTPSENR